MGAETRTALAPDRSATSVAGRRGPLLALVLIVLVATVGYALAAQLVSTPRVHPDEHIYGGAAASLAEGDGLRLRGDDVRARTGVPGRAGTSAVVTGDRETAYHFYRVVNAFLFALSAIPIFLLARRLLRPWWSVGVAALAIAIPSSMYVSLVMTESASYLVYSARACSRSRWPSNVLRQLASWP